MMIQLQSFWDHFITQARVLMYHSLLLSGLSYAIRGLIRSERSAIKILNQ